MILVQLAVLIWSIAFLTDLLLVILWIFYFKNPERPIKDWPTVAVLVAARNEELNLEACIKSLLQLDYPIHQLEIWIGDDHSEDETWAIIERYKQKFAHIHGIRVMQHTSLGNGKANVLSQLVPNTQANWLFFTDADIQVPTSWLKAMLQGAKAKQAAMVTGTSLVIGNGLLAQIQRLDWLNATAMLKLISDLGVPVASMGNNMAIKRVAYQAVGGFEGLPFSVTEDLELFKAVKKRFKTINLFNANLLNKSTPQSSIHELLKQRKRWMRGAFELPWQLLTILIVQAIYFPAMLVMLFINPTMAIVFWSIKWVVKWMFQYLTSKKIKENISIFYSFVTEIFNMVFSWVSVLYYFLPGKVVWKGRKY